MGYNSVSKSHISTLSATLWQALIEGERHKHTHTHKRQHLNKLPSDPWQWLERKGSCWTLFYKYRCTISPPQKKRCSFISLLSVCLSRQLSACVSVIECTQVMVLCPQGSVEVYMQRIDQKKKVPWWIMFQQLMLGNSSLMDSVHFLWQIWFYQLCAVGWNIRGSSSCCRIWGTPQIPEEGSGDNN